VVLDAVVATFLEIITPFASIGTGVIAALLTSARARTQAEKQQRIEDHRREVDWARQRQTFVDQQNKEREMFVATVEAEARTEVRARAHEHAQALIGPLVELQDVVEKYPRTHPSDAGNLMAKCLETFQDMKVDVAYQDADLRERFAILFHVYEAIGSPQYPYKIKYNAEFLLKHIGDGTLDSLMARLRGEDLPPLNGEQIYVQDLYPKVRIFEEAEIDRWIADHEAQQAHERAQRRERGERQE
jgi:hypothetical protein